MWEGVVRGRPSGSCERSTKLGIKNLGQAHVFYHTQVISKPASIFELELFLYKCDHVAKGNIEISSHNIVMVLPLFTVPGSILGGVT